MREYRREVFPFAMLCKKMHGVVLTKRSNSFDFAIVNVNWRVRKMSTLVQDTNINQNCCIMNQCVVMNGINKN